jgi:hypothetical protein
MLCAVLLLTSALPAKSLANSNKACRGHFITFSDFDLSGMGPMKFSGMNLSPSSPDLADSGTLEIPFCTCAEGSGGSSYWGMVFSYWEIGKLLVTRQNAFCDPVTGLDYNFLPPGNLNGNQEEKVEGAHTFTQWMLADFPLLSIFGLAGDIKCLQQGGADYTPLLFSELNPAEQKDIWTAVAYPISFLGMFPFADLACAPALISTLARIPPTYFPFCAWGLVFPLNGSKNGNNKLEANAANAAKVLVKESLNGTIRDNVKNYCSGTLRPVWDPGQFRMAMVRPTKSRPFMINDPASLWGFKKNTPMGTEKAGPDDFLFTVYQKKRCCEKVKKNQ